MKVRWSRVLSVRRVDPFRFSVGDEALVEMGPGLLQFLNFRDSRGGRLGDGLAPEWVLPIAAAGTAAFAVVCEEANPWTAVANDVVLRRTCEEGETLLATASIEAMRRASVRIPYRVHSRERRDLLVEGAFVFACVGPEGPRPYDPVIHARPGEGPAEPESGTADPVVPISVEASPTLRRTRWFDDLLPHSVARTLRLTYWHFLSLRGSSKTSPTDFIGGLVRVLRSSEGREAPAAAPPPPSLPETPTTRPTLRWSVSTASLGLGETAQFAVEVFNAGIGRLEGELEIAAPCGYGLDVAATGPMSVSLGPGDAASYPVSVTARRPDEVNLGRPWAVTCVLRGGGSEIASERLLVAVADPEHGTLFYVLTEDCETFDGGEKTGDYGAAGELGNRNNFMDPEEYRIQMIAKPEALNAIAERHGARWTHFWTATQRFAAQWAARQSKTGAWDAVVAELDASISRGSRLHEYAPHIHFDFEPDSALPPQPRLFYDARTDGIIPNEYYDLADNPHHKFHGWDGARKGIAYVRSEGDLATVDSKKGSLRKSARYLAQLSFGGRLSLTARTGAADFGATARDLAISTQAAFANGLLADSDAGLYETAAPLPRGRQMYFCKADDLDREIDGLAEAALVELRAPDQMLEQGSTEDLNAWFARRFRESQGPGVRAIVGMTHAMFMRGDPDPFRDTRGGAFERLGHHLEQVKRAYPGVRFATASEAVLEFLDYYTPVPKAVVAGLHGQSLDGTALLYRIRILGRGIPITAGRPALLTVQAPAMLGAEEIRSMSVLEDGVPLPDAEFRATPDALPAIRFRATRHAGYLLRIETSRPRHVSLFEPSDFAGLWSSTAARFEEAPEEEMPDLLRLEPPRLVRGAAVAIDAVSAGQAWEWVYPGDLFHLLVNPVAGNPHPLGRRLHPYGRFSEGIAVDAALKLFGSTVRPARIDLQWVRPVRGQADFQLLTTVEAVTPEQVVLANSVRESGIEVARLKLTLARTGAAAPT